MVFLIACFSFLSYSFGANGVCIYAFSHAIHTYPIRAYIVHSLLAFQSIDQPASQPIVVAPISLFSISNMRINGVKLRRLSVHWVICGHTAQPWLFIGAQACESARVSACVCSTYCVHCTINRGQSKWDGNTKQWCDHVYDWLGTIIYIFMCIYCVNVLMLLTLCLLQCCTLRPMQHFIPQTAYHDMPLLRTRWKFQFI